eukprot:jgi/Ulvmu1/160/UM001_0164.1
MPMNAAIGAAVGAAVGAAAAYGFLQTQRPSATAPSAPVSGRLTERHPVYKYGIPIKERIREFPGYVVAFDPATRCPIWVMEKLTKQTAHGEAKRDNVFKEDLVIPQRFRSKLQDYARSGYDRGHMAPCMNHTYDQKDMDDTFYLTNMAPQVGKGFNQDYWARFEKFVKNVHKRSEAVYIVTGPIFAPLFTNNGLQSNHSFIGTPPNAVAVPTHFFKVILAEHKSESGGSKLSVGAFAMPNRPIPPNTPLTSFCVPLDMLESLTGIEFFPGALTERQRSSIDLAATDWRYLGMAQQQALAIQGSQQAPDVLPGASSALVPASQLPPAAELLKTGVSAGPPKFRPRRANANGAAHLCEEVWCQLPPENFWEGGKGKGKGRPAGV